MSDSINRIEIMEWPNGKYDFRIIAAENGNILCASHQGYEDSDFCQAMAKRATTSPVDSRITFTKE